MNRWTGENNIAVFSIHPATGKPTLVQNEDPQRAPPPARRSTLDWIADQGLEEGSSAHAEIGPYHH